MSPFDYPGAWEADLEQVWDLRDGIALLVGRMDTFSERFRASCFNGWQPVDEHHGEDVDHYEAAAAHARRLGASCNGDWWRAKEAEDAERCQQAAAFATDGERKQDASKRAYEEAALRCR